MNIRVATRNSALAIAQTEWALQEIKKHHPQVEFELVAVSTRGDKIQDRPLREVGGKGLFVSEVEALLVEGKADIAIHSLKDIPGDQALAEGFELVCFPRREDARDVFVSYTHQNLESLPSGSKVGTSSLRRTSNLVALRSDLEVEMLRGNVGTRLQRLEEKKYDAILLAAAGLKRLHLLNVERDHPLDLTSFIPAIGQGTLAIEACLSDGKLLNILESIDDTESRICASAERSLLLEIGGNCYTPLAGYAWIEEQKLSLVSVLANEKDLTHRVQVNHAISLPITKEEQIAVANELGKTVGKKLLQKQKSKSG